MIVRSCIDTLAAGEETCVHICTWEETPAMVSVMGDQLIA